MFHPLANSRQLGQTSKRYNDEQVTPVSIVAFHRLGYLQFS